MLKRVVFSGVVLAESHDNIVVEGDHYRQLEALRREFVDPHRMSVECAGVLRHRAR